MRKAILVLAVVLVLVGIFAVSALTEVFIDRDIRVAVLTDISDNVPVKFTEGVNYPGVLVDDGSGRVVIDLSNAFGENGGLNPHGTFTIGSNNEGEGVFQITNNSNFAITVNMNSTFGNAELIGPETLNAGITGEYGIKLTTGAQAPSGVSVGTLQIR